MDAADAPSTTVERAGLRAFLLYFLRLGTFGFGGPIALAGHMQQDLVEQRRWISAQGYKEGLALAQLAPGPLAAQLAMYLGWVQAGGLGATLVALAFVGPSFLMVLALSALYVRFGGLPWMQGVFYGIGAAVIAVIARSVLKLARMTLRRDRLLWALFIASALVTAWTESEIVWVFLVSGLVPLLLRGRHPAPAPPALALLPVAPALATGLGGPASVGILWKILAYFAGAGLFVFGSGLAIVPFLYGGVVQQFHWLTERQFIDAVAVSMITPGPVVITVAFIGYLVAGLAGATLAAIGVFLPVYLVVIFIAPHFHRVAKNRQVKAFVDGVTAAATGAIAGAAVILGRRSLLDVPTILIALVTLALLLVPRKIPEPVLIVGAGLLGLALRGAAPAAGDTPMRSLAVVVLALVGPPQTRTSGCTLGGPPVRARWAGAIPAASTAAPPLRVVGDVPLPGSASRFDYQSLDPAAGRLFISHMGAGQLVVFDVGAGRVVASLDGFPTVTGVLAVPAEHRVYASATGDHAVVVVDDATLGIVARVTGPRFPDGIAYAPGERRVFVSDESGRRDFVLEAATNTVVARIDLDGEAGNTQYDAGSHCVIVAVQTANQLAVIDPATAAVVRRITLDPAVRYPHGVSVDAPHRVAFIAGQESATLGVLDLRTLELRAVLPIGADPDVLAFDPVLGRLYVAAESGVVAVFEERDGSLVQLGWYRAPRAHSVAVDPATHRVYLPLASVNGRPVLRVLMPPDSS